METLNLDEPGALKLLLLTLAVLVAIPLMVVALIILPTVNLKDSEYWPDPA